MGKYAEFSQKVLENVGGLDNITFVAHCATRLRISYADGSKINEAAIKALPECAGIVKKANQLQIIIGPQVPDAYYDFLEVSGWKAALARLPDNRNFYRNSFQMAQLRHNFYRSALHSGRNF